MKTLKVGDKVRINSIEWHNKNKDKNGNILHKDFISFAKEMAIYCGKEAIIVKVLKDEGLYKLDVDNKEWSWAEYMFETIEEEVKENFIDPISMKTIERIMNAQQAEMELQNLFIWVSLLKKGKEATIPYTDERIQFIANYIKELKDGSREK